MSFYDDATRYPSRHYTYDSFPVPLDPSPKSYTDEPAIFGDNGFDRPSPPPAFPMPMPTPHQPHALQPPQNYNAQYCPSRNTSPFRTQSYPVQPSHPFNPPNPRSYTVPFEQHVSHETRSLQEGAVDLWKLRPPSTEKLSKEITAGRLQEFSAEVTQGLKHQVTNPEIQGIISDLRAASIKFNAAVRTSNGIALESLCLVQEIISMLEDMQYDRFITEHRVAAQLDRCRVQRDGSIHCASQFTAVKADLLKIQKKVGDELEARDRRQRRAVAGVEVALSILLALSVTAVAVLAPPFAALVAPIAAAGVVGGPNSDSRPTRDAAEWMVNLHRSCRSTGKVERETLNHLEIVLTSALDQTEAFKSWWDSQEAVLQTLGSSGSLRWQMQEARPDVLRRFMADWIDAKSDLEGYTRMLREASLDKSTNAIRLLEV